MPKPTGFWDILPDVMSDADEESLFDFIFELLGRWRGRKAEHFAELNMLFDMGFDLGVKGTANLLIDRVPDSNLFQGTITVDMPQAPNMPTSTINPYVTDYLKRNAGIRSKLIDNTTKKLVAKELSRAYRQGLSKEEIMGLLENKFPEWIKTESRALMIARTEMAIAFGEGGYQEALAQGCSEKMWNYYPNCCDRCRDNGNFGWVEIDFMYPSGIKITPEHPNCRCYMLYRKGSADNLY